VGRRTAILLVTVAASIAVGPAALAKGPLVPASGTAMISGPRLATPIVISWKGRCFEFATFACQEQPIPGDFWTLVSDAGLGGYQPASLAVISFPRPANEGPRYRVTYLMTLDGRTAVVRQDLFPYGPATYTGGQSHPWFWTPYRQVAFGQPVQGGWWPATATVRTMLEGRGLPPAALAAMAVAGAVAGRPRGRLRTA